MQTGVQCLLKPSSVLDWFGLNRIGLDWIGPLKHIPNINKYTKNKIENKNDDESIIYNGTLSNQVKKLTGTSTLFMNQFASVCVCWFFIDSGSNNKRKIIAK